MRGKFGSSFAREMLDRGRRELGGFLYPDSNIAQPMYPSRGDVGPARDPPDQSPGRSVLDERLDRIGRDDPGPGAPGRDGPQPNGPDMDR